MRTGYMLYAMLLSACVDFGVGVDTSQAEEAIDEGGTGGAIGDCVEGPADPSPDGPQLRFVSMAVDNPNLSIQAGDVVTWTNGDSMRHAAVAGAPGSELPPDRGGFNSGELGQGRSWAWRFCDPGERVWFCSTHPAQMNGYRITVE